MAAMGNYLQVADPARLNQCLIAVLFVVKVYDYLVTDWVCLAGQNKAVFYFPGLQAVADIHVNFAFQQFCFAGSTHAILAGERQVHALVDAGVE